MAAKFERLASRHAGSRGRAQMADAVRCLDEVAVDELTRLLATQGPQLE